MVVCFVEWLGKCQNLRPGRGRGSLFFYAAHQVGVPQAMEFAYNRLQELIRIRLTRIVNLKNGHQVLMKMEH